MNFKKQYKKTHQHYKKYTQKQQNPQNILMLQMAIYKTRVPDILGDKREFMPVRDVICLILNESRSQCVAVCCSALQCVRERERLKKRESE